MLPGSIGAKLLVLHDRNLQKQVQLRRNLFYQLSLMRVNEKMITLEGPQ